MSCFPVSRANAPPAPALIHIELGDLIVFWMNLSSSYVDTTCSLSKRGSGVASGTHESSAVSAACGDTGTTEAAFLFHAA